MSILSDQELSDGGSMIRDSQAAAANCEPPPTCTYCSTLNILTNYFHYQSFRQKYYLYSDLSNIFKVIPPKSLISFIKEI